MLVTVLLQSLAFLLTFAETAVSTWEGKADREDRSVVAANWALVFEGLLIVDIVLVVADPVVYAPVILAAAWLGKLWAVERRKRMIRRNTITPTT